MWPPPPPPPHQVYKPPSPEHRTPEAYFGAVCAGAQQWRDCVPVPTSRHARSGRRPSGAGASFLCAPFGVSIACTWGEKWKGIKLGSYGPEKQLTIKIKFLSTLPAVKKYPQLCLYQRHNFLSYPPPPNQSYDIFELCGPSRPVLPMPQYSVEMVTPGLGGGGWNEGKFDEEYWHKSTNYEPNNLKNCKFMQHKSPISTLSTQVKDDKQTWLYG